MRNIKDQSNVVGLRIKNIRNLNNLSQDRFGKKIGLSGKTISSYETGRCIPPLYVLKDISHVYDVPLMVVKEEKKHALSEKIVHIQSLLQEINSAISGSV
ncbi:MAG TPA: helix-turn-helix transcriptional regulator [Patescibacteria group bacterium]|nr:helix-turn-helix transcriptional regulator [Patescibacteria group bacterium]